MTGYSSQCSISMHAYVSALSQDGWPKLQILLQLMIHLKWPLPSYDLSPPLEVLGAEKWSEVRHGVGVCVCM